jgi:hypothetical protein
MNAKAPDVVASGNLFWVLPADYENLLPAFILLFIPLILHN